MKVTKIMAMAVMLASVLSPFAVTAQTDKLEEIIAALEARIEALEARLSESDSSTPPPVAAGDNNGVTQKIAGVVKINSNFSYEMLDPATNINRKNLFLLEQKQQGNIAEKGIYLGGAVTGLADYWHSNRNSKFGYLMRHPTANNQIGKTVTEAGIHSAQFSLMANMGDWITAYSEFLYDPQQSFGRGTITTLTRNQIQLRQGYVTIGNLDKSPFYLTLGKMATPFGLTDTVNPFTASTTWHAFGGLAYGVMLGYSNNGLDVRAELVQGGSQFRAANVPVEGTTVPSKLNNYVIDASYTFALADENDTAMIGASYERGSAYCQGYPVFHFMPCAEENPAWAVYGKVDVGQFTFIGEFNKTTDLWPGTFNPHPDLSQFAASKVSSAGLGGKYETSMNGKRVDYSLEYSIFNAGDDGSPWERQDQLVLGGAYFLTDTVKLFAEGILVRGYAPLNFISGGGGPNIGPGQTHSDRDARNLGLVMGINVVY